MVSVFSFDATVVLSVSLAATAFGVFALGNKMAAAQASTVKQPSAVTAAVIKTPEIKTVTVSSTESKAAEVQNFTSKDAAAKKAEEAKKVEEAAVAEPATIKDLHNPMYSRVYPGMESESQAPAEEESYGEITEESKAILFDTYTEAYGKDVVTALREHFGDEKALEHLAEIERAPFRSRVYPGMESENENTGNDESIGELTEESKQVLIESLTDSYGEKMVNAFREQFGDERAISTLLSMRDSVSYSRVYTGMEQA